MPARASRGCGRIAGFGEVVLYLPETKRDTYHIIMVNPEGYCGGTEVGYRGQQHAEALYGQALAVRSKLETDAC